MRSKRLVAVVFACMAIIMIAQSQAGAVRVNRQGRKVYIWVQSWYSRRGYWDPIVKLYAFGHNFGFNTASAPTQTVPDGTGDWTAGFVSSDPFGGDRPLGGVEWSTTGAGLDTSLDWEASFSADMLGDETTMDVYTYDCATQTYTSFLNLAVPAPEPTGLMALGSGLIGMAGLALRRRR